MAYLLYVPIRRHCHEKWRQSGALHFCMLMLLRKRLILLKKLKRGEKSSVLLAAYKPYTQSAESVLYILVSLGLLWLQLGNTYRKFKPK